VEAGIVCILEIRRKRAFRRRSLSAPSRASRNRSFSRMSYDLA
jgi:hypothetical protein